MRRIGIVGGGFSGTCLLYWLIRETREPLAILWLERSGAFAEGAAYGTERPEHLLNVRADNMGAFPDKPGDFHRWLEQRDGVADRAAFYPRRDYAEYLQHVLAEAELLAERKSVTIRRISGEALSLDAEGRLHYLENGEKTEKLDAIALATGNGLPERPGFVAEEAWNAPSFIRNPWAWDDENIMAQGTTVIIGTGLTAVDALMSLHVKGWESPVHCISRHGLLPRPHASAPPVDADWLDALPQPPVLGRLFRAIIEQSRKHHWRAVIDAMRPRIQGIWKSLPDKQKRIFLTRYFTLWNVHRHRMPPHVHNILDKMQEEGQLHIHAGHIKSIELDGDAFTVHLKEGVAIPASLVINATGPGYGLERTKNPLLRQLLQSGYILPHATGFGLRAGYNFHAEGSSPIPLYALGSLLVGELLETTAVPELRTQAMACAHAIIQG